MTEFQKQVLAKLERMAAALENGENVTVVTTPRKPPPVPNPPAEPEPRKPQSKPPKKPEGAGEALNGPPVETTAEAPPPPAPPAAPVIELADMQKYLNDVYVRDGNSRDNIDQVLAAAGGHSLNEIDPTMYSQILDQLGVNYGA